MRFAVKGRWRKALIALLVLLSVPASYVVYSGVLQLTGNFHTVIPGEFYRSGQPSGADIAAYKAKYGIKTIINLRGGPRRSKWYREEVETAQRLGIAHFNFYMSPRHIFRPYKAKELLALFEKAEKPILIHCRAGADRSGLASALYLVATGRGEEAADKQVSLRYGHVGVLHISASRAMPESLERLLPRLRSLKLIPATK